MTRTNAVREGVRALRRTVASAVPTSGETVSRRSCDSLCSFASDPQRMRQTVAPHANVRHQLGKRVIHTRAASWCTAVNDVDSRQNHQRTRWSGPRGCKRCEGFPGAMRHMAPCGLEGPSRGPLVRPVASFWPVLAASGTACGAAAGAVSEGRHGVPAAGWRRAPVAASGASRGSRVGASTGPLRPSLAAVRRGPCARPCGSRRCAAGLGHRACCGGHSPAAVSRHLGVPMSRSEGLFCARFLWLWARGRTCARMAVSGPLRRSRSLPWPVAAGTWTWRCATAPALLAVVTPRGLYGPRPACRRRTPFASPRKKIRDLAPWPAWSLLNLSWSLLDHRRFECCPQWSLLDH